MDVVLSWSGGKDSAMALYELGFPFLSLDAIKETLGDQLGTGSDVIGLAATTNTGSSAFVTR